MKVTRYAEGTGVSVERSRAEVDALLTKHGAMQRVIAIDDARGLATVGFSMDGRQYRIELPLPKVADHTPKKAPFPHGWLGWDEKKRTAWVAKACEQKQRERWRAMVLVLKAKLEIVALGFSTVEREFLADLMLPSGKRLHAMVEGEITQAYLSGKPPTLMLGVGQP